MAHLLTSDDKYRDLIYDDAYRSYLITRRDSPGDYRFGRMHGKRVRVRARSAFRRVNGYLKNMIEAIANSKMRRMERELELRGVGLDRPNNNWVALKANREFAMTASAVIAFLRSVVSSLVTFLGPSWDGPVRKYRPEEHYMRGPGPTWREKHYL